MLSDQQVISSLQVAFEAETAGLEPARGLLARVEEELRAPEPAPPRRRHWRPSLGGMFATLSVAGAAAVAIIVLTGVRHGSTVPGPLTPAAEGARGHRCHALAAACRHAVHHVVSTRPYVLNHPIGTVWLCLYLVTILLLVSQAAQHVGSGENRDRGSLWLIIGCCVPGVVLFLLAPHFASGAVIRPSVPFIWAGMTLWVAGTVLRVWSMHTLGKWFAYKVMIAVDQSVVASGPYRLVRHPNYVGILLMIVGVGLVWGNWVGLVILFGFILVPLLYRIVVEEEALTDSLGDAYEFYAARHSRLIPFVW